MTVRSLGQAGASTCATCGADVPARSGACPQCGAAQVRPATVPARMAALTLDIAAVAIVASVVLLSTRSLAFAAVAAIEATLALWILQARAGLGLGNAVMRLRTARVDKPYSPGGGRALLRGVCTAAGFAVLAVGAWLLELTGVADRSGWRRSWADRAAGTMVVEVPRRPAPATTAAAAVTGTAAAPVPAEQARPFVARPAAAVSAGSGRGTTSLITGVPSAGVTAGVAAPAPVAVPARPAAPDVPGPRRSTAVPPQGEDGNIPVAPQAAASAPPQTAAPAGSRRARRAATGDVPVMPPAPGPRRSSAPPAAVGRQTLLLAFDTGERWEVPVPCALVLGRRPRPIEDGDLVITVDDPQRTVSSVHARLEVGAEDAWVTDLDSTNGSDLLTEDGASRRIPPQQRMRVEDGTRMRIGDRIMTMTRLAGDTE